jgi:anthranilate phosphoribosyltransferase
VCAAVFELDIASSELGFLNPDVPYAIDNAGMGGDLQITANVSTLAALIAATAGIPMCKHGSPANADQGKHGSSDFIELLGIDASVPKEVMEQCVEEHSFGYIEALDTRYKHIHRLTHDIAKLPHMNDIIGPITSPLNPRLLTRRIVGINQLIPTRVVAEAYLILNRKGITHLEHGLFIRGFADTDRKRGIDELSICAGGTQVAELRGDEIRQFDLGAEDFGLEPVPAESISPPAGMTKGDFSLRILRQEERGPAMQMVLANAALIFVLVGKATSYPEGYEMARAVLASGKVEEKVLEVKNALSAAMVA